MLIRATRVYWDETPEAFLVSVSLSPTTGWPRICWGQSHKQTSDLLLPLLTIYLRNMTPQRNYKCSACWERGGLRPLSPYILGWFLLSGPPFPHLYIEGDGVGSL